MLPQQKPMFAVYRFFKDYAAEREVKHHTNPVTGDTVEVRVKVPGKMREVHKVEYGPLGSDKTRVTMIVDHLRPKVEYGVEPQEGSSQWQAIARWQVIEPLYERWLAGLEITPDGTPLAAWAGVGPEQAEALRMKGIHTVQQLAALSDSHFERYGIGGLRNLRDHAKRFLDTTDTAAFQSLIEERDIIIEGLKDTVANYGETLKQMQQQMALMQEQQATTSLRADEPSLPLGDDDNSDAFGVADPDLVPVERPRKTARRS